MHSFKLSFDLKTDSLCGLQVVLLSRRLPGVRGRRGEGAGQLLCSPWSVSNCTNENQKTASDSKWTATSRHIETSCSDSSSQEELQLVGGWTEDSSLYMSVSTPQLDQMDLVQQKCWVKWQAVNRELTAKLVRKSGVFEKYHLLNCSSFSSFCSYFSPASYFCLPTSAPGCKHRVNWNTILEICRELGIPKGLSLLPLPASLHLAADFRRFFSVASSPSSLLLFSLLFFSPLLPPFYFLQLDNFIGKMHGSRPPSPAGHPSAAKWIEFSLSSRPYRSVRPTSEPPAAVRTCDLLTR